MDQVKFMMMANNVHPEGAILQSEKGIVTVNLRPGQIVITHNYRRNNEMQIMFMDNHDKFIIPSEKELQEIYQFHLSNKDVVSILHEYCNNNLEKIII